MNTIETIRSTFQSQLRDWTDNGRGRIYCGAPAVNIVAISRALIAEHGLRFVIISGIDSRERIELMYHFAHDATGTVLTVRIMLDRQAPVVDTLSGVLKGAWWIEREIHELLGVTFSGHPEPKHLLLSDDWPAGDFPLRQKP